MVMEHPMAGWWFAVENASITAGYVFVALVVAPLFMRRVGVAFWWTKVGAVGFFVLCGLTHADMAGAAMFMADDAPMATQWWMQAVHALQAVAVWMFVIGLYVELTDVDWRPRETREETR